MTVSGITIERPKVGEEFPLKLFSKQPVLDQGDVIGGGVSVKFEKHPLFCGCRGLMAVCVVDEVDEDVGFIHACFHHD